MRSLAVLIVVALSTPALAQAPGETVPLSSPATPAEDKSPDTAVLLSVGVTGAGLLTTISGAKSSGTLALVGIGAMYFGPSVGRWYAGSDGIGSLGLRAVGGASALLGVALLIGSGECEGVDCPNHDALYGTMFFGGLGLWAGTSIYDIVMAGRDANRWNRERYALQLRPTTVSMAGHHGVGLALAGHF